MRAANDAVAATPTQLEVLRKAGVVDSGGEGYRVILVNSNPATIMTEPDLSDGTYVEPHAAATRVVRHHVARGA